MKTGAHRVIQNKSIFVFKLNWRQLGFSKWLKKFSQKFDFKNEIWVSSIDLKVSWKSSFLDCVIATYVIFSFHNWRLNLKYLRMFLIFLQIYLRSNKVTIYLRLKPKTAIVNKNQITWRQRWKKPFFSYARTRNIEKNTPPNEKFVFHINNNPEWMGWEEGIL